jgi:hypothetical protein
VRAVDKRLCTLLCVGAETVAPTLERIDEVGIISGEGAACTC